MPQSGRHVVLMLLLTQIQHAVAWMSVSHLDTIYMFISLGKRMFPEWLVLIRRAS